MAFLDQILVAQDLGRFAAILVTWLSVVKLFLAPYIWIAIAGGLTQNSFAHENHQYDTLARTVQDAVALHTIGDADDPEPDL